MTQTTIRACFNLHLSRTHQSAFSLQVDLTLPATGITVLFGHSGSGKTTLLRCMAGLQQQAQGKMQVGNEVWQDQKSYLATHKRQLAYVFQEASLLPHLSVQDNLYYALKRAKYSNSNLSSIIALMGLQSILEQLPAQLSGGEKQRVALARTLITQPKLILMDEPLASLDQARKQEILPYLEKLKASAHVPIIYVSHDINEVARLADHLVVLEEGKVVLQGSVNQVLPRIAKIDGLTEETSVVHSAEVCARDVKWHLIQVKLTECQSSYLWLRDSGELIGQILRLRLLAKDVSIALENHDDSSIVNRLPATISALLPDLDPSMVLVQMCIGSGCLIARITQRSLSHLKLEIGMKVWAQIKSVAIIN